MDKIKLTILLAIFIDIIGIGIVMPALPFYAESFGATPFITTSLFAVFSVCAFFSGPFLGALSDRIGRRPVLIMSIISTSLGWLVFANAKNMTMLFVGRVIDGLAAGNIVAGQGYLVDIAKNEKERMTNIGLIGAAFGVGFIVGPMLGGLLSSLSHAAPFWFVGALAAVNAVMAYLLLPETNRNLSKDKPLRINPFLPLIKAVMSKRLRPIYLGWLFFMLAVAIFQTITALYMGKVYGWGEAGVGWLMTFLGAVIAFNQGFALKKVWLKYFSEHKLSFWVPLFGASAYLMMSLGSLALLFVGLAISGLAQSLLRVVTTSRAVGLADPQEKGETLGIMNSLNSLAMVASPLVAGAIFVINPALPFVLAALLMAISFFIAFFNRSDEAGALPDEPASEMIL